jgi:hypothetical protein
MISEKLTFEYLPQYETKGSLERLQTDMGVLGKLYDIAGNGEIAVGKQMDWVRLNPKPGAEIKQLFVVKEDDRPSEVDSYVGRLIAADFGEPPFLRILIWNDEPVYRQQFLIHQKPEIRY